MKKTILLSVLNLILISLYSQNYTKKDFNKLSYYQKSVVKNWCINNDVEYPIYKDTTITEENKWQVHNFSVQKEEVFVREEEDRKIKEDYKRIITGNYTPTPYLYLYPNFYNLYPNINYNFPYFDVAGYYLYLNSVIIDSYQYR